MSANRGFGRSELLEITDDAGEYSYDMEGRSRLCRCVELTLLNSIVQRFDDGWTWCGVDVVD